MAGSALCQGVVWALIAVLSLPPDTQTAPSMPAISAPGKVGCFERSLTVSMQLLGNEQCASHTGKLPNEGPLCADRESTVCKALLPSMQAAMLKGWSIKGGKHSLSAFMRKHAAACKGYL